MQNNDQIFQEIIGDGPLMLQSLPTPYSDEAALEEKFITLYRILRRSIKLKARLPSLLNAFLLGKLLSEIETSAEQFQYKRRMTPHYVTITDRTYDLFEYLPAHIYVTKFLTIQQVRLIKRPDLTTLRNKLLDHIAGAQNLEGEDCWRHSTAPTVPQIVILVLTVISVLLCLSFIFIIGVIFILFDIYILLFVLLILFIFILLVIFYLSFIFDISFIVFILNIFIITLYVVYFI
jgi:hypothetical protein